eukprot:1328818-Alexandrium_andersonii.AAC.1
MQASSKRSPASTARPARPNGCSNQRSTSGSNGARRSSSTVRIMDITVLSSFVVSGQCVCSKMRRRVAACTLSSRTRQPWSSPVVAMKQSTASASVSAGFCQGNRGAAYAPASAGGGT